MSATAVADAAHLHTPGPHPSLKASKRGDVVLASLQQLCSMGLSSEMAMPALLEALPRWLPTDIAQFFWVDDKLQPVNYHCNTDHIRAADYFADHCEHLDIPEMPSYADFLRHHASMTHGGPHDPGYFGSAFYNEVARDMGGECLLCIVVRDSHQGLPRGSLCLIRDKRMRPFTAQERQQGEMLAAHVSLLFSQPSPSVSEQVERCAAQGMALLERDGNLAYCDDTARRLLFLAGHPGFNASAMARQHGQTLSRQLRQLCATLDNMFAGRPSAPPTFSIRLPAGRFVFRARQLSQAGGARQGVIGLDIAHYLPRRVVTWRRVQAFELPPRLQQVCIEFAEGTSLSEIAALLGISRHTVIDHVNRIYQRFGLEPSREMLQEYLQGPF